MRLDEIMGVCGWLANHKAPIQIESPFASFGFAVQRRFGGGRGIILA